jgi:hypothetical protein
MAKKKQHGGKREGAGRPVSPDGHTVTVVVTVPETLMHRLEGIAEANGWNKSEAVTQAIRAFVAKR